MTAIVDLVEKLTSWHSLALILVVFGFAPGFVLRGLVRIYPKDDPRRAELLAQLYVLKRTERPLFVAEQLETVLFEGVPNRARASWCALRRVGAKHRPAIWVNGRAFLVLAGLSASLTALVALCGVDTRIASLAVVATLIVFMFVLSNKNDLRAMRARPMTEAEQPKVFRIVREIATIARRPMPRLYVSPTRAPIALAAGRNSRTAIVCCTTGMVELLCERELRAVLAHELAQVYNHDVLLARLSRQLAFVFWLLGMVAGVTVHGMGCVFLGWSPDERYATSEPVIEIAVGALTALVVRLLVGSGPEYRTDALAVKLTGDPDGLALALRKVSIGIQSTPLVPEPGLVTLAYLMFANPFHVSDQQRWSPRAQLQERIMRLEVMRQNPGE